MSATVPCVLVIVQGNFRLERLYVHSPWVPWYIENELMCIILDLNCITFWLHPRLAISQVLHVPESSFPVNGANSIQSTASHHYNMDAHQTDRFMWKECCTPNKNWLQFLINVTGAPWMFGSREMDMNVNFIFKHKIISCKSVTNAFYWGST